MKLRYIEIDSTFDSAPALVSLARLPKRGVHQLSRIRKDDFVTKKDFRKDDFTVKSLTLQSTA